MIPKLNERKWYEQLVRIDIARVSLLTLVGCLELVLRCPDLPDNVRQSSIKTGRAFALTLLDNGLIVPDQVRRAWEEAFDIPYEINPDKIIPGLTDSEGRPWK